MWRYIGILKKKKKKAEMEKTLSVVIFEPYLEMLLFTLYKLKKKKKPPSKVILLVLFMLKLHTQTTVRLDGIMRYFLLKIEWIKQENTQFVE